MIQRIIHKSNDNHDLILIFLGWGTDAQAISTLRYPGCDIMAVWDYRDPSFDTSHIQRYHNIYKIIIATTDNITTIKPPV